MYVCVCVGATSLRVCPFAKQAAPRESGGACDTLWLATADFLSHSDSACTISAAALYALWTISLVSFFVSTLRLTQCLLHFPVSTCFSLMC